MPSAATSAGKASGSAKRRRMRRRPGNRGWRDRARATNRAEAILARFVAESSSSSIVIPHDCRIEMFDNVKAVDGSTTYPENSLSRVTGLRHYYNRYEGVYRLTIYMGGLSELPLLPYSEEKNPFNPGLRNPVPRPRLPENYEGFIPPGWLNPDGTIPTTREPKLPALPPITPTKE